MTGKRIFIEGEIYRVENVFLKVIFPGIKSVNQFIDGSLLVFMYPENYNDISDLIVPLIGSPAVLGHYAKKDSFVKNEPLSDAERNYDLGIVITTAGSVISEKLCGKYSEDHTVMGKDGTYFAFPIYDVHGNRTDRVPGNLIADGILYSDGVDSIIDRYDRGETVKPFGSGVFFD